MTLCGDARSGPWCRGRYRDYGASSPSPGASIMRFRSFGLVVLALVLVLGTGVALAFPNDGASWDATESPNRRMMILGDSLVVQAGPTALALAAQREHVLDVRPINGGAPCDLTPVYGGWATAFRPQAVAFAFVGNATSACMMAETGISPVPARLTATQVTAITAAYRRHLLTLIRWNQARGIESWLIAPPIMAAGTWHGQLNASLNTMYRDLATAAGARYSSSGRSLLSPAGVFAYSVAGLPVRHTDGTHLRAPYGTTLFATGLLSGVMTGNP